VLVVDDHPTNLMVLEQQLHLLNCDAELAADGRQALEKSAAQPFHLILMDCHLPDIDGYTVAERIRAREAEAGAHTPILAITAATDEAHQQRVMDSGMDGMLTKPIRLDNLREMIELWCDTGRAAAAPTPAPAGEDRDLWSIYFDSLDDDLESLAHALDAGDPAARRARWKPRWRRPAPSLPMHPPRSPACAHTAMRCGRRTAQTAPSTDRRSPCRTALTRCAARAAAGSPAA
jgi:CheY-like chemotaxis protein